MKVTVALYESCACNEVGRDSWLCYIDDVTNTIMEVSKSLNKVPAEVNDYPGFVANRILMPMINEAIICYMRA